MDDEKIRRIVIENALKYGKSDTKFVINKIIGENKDLIKNIKELAQKVNQIVNEVNSLSRDKLEEEASILGITLKKEEKEFDLKPLPNVNGEVILRIPPEPSGYMHLGHAISFMINYLYKLKYNGKLVLRFEDTNPEKVKKEYIDYFKKYISWLGIKWDVEKIASNDMEIIYNYGEKLIKEGKAYICTCSKEQIKENRLKGIACSCRSRNVEENLELWELAKTGKIEEGKATVRLIGDMKSEDMSLRDPNIFRIKFTKYKNYTLWPLYDFENTIEDYLDKVTHIIRSNEFKNSVQNLIREYLNFTKPTIIQYARFNFEGTPFSKRKIRELISQGKISSWEDLRLPTMNSIERRGILPQAIKEFVIRNGYSESSHTYEWESLLTLNRKILDPISKRLFFVIDPLKININYDGEIEIPYHPTQNLGKRKIKVNGFVYISKNDLEYDKLLRLKDFVSVRINKDNTAVIVSKEKIGNEKIIQWVGNDFLNAKLVKINELLKGEDINPESLKEYDGFLESNGSLLSEGEIVQFERIGFARLDNKEKNVFIYSC